MIKKYKYFPQNKDEVKTLVNNKKIKLSNIDISKVDDLSELFYGKQAEKFQRYIKLGRITCNEYDRYVLQCRK